MESRGQQEFRGGGASVLPGMGPLLLLRLLFSRNKEHTKIFIFFFKKREQSKIVLLAPWNNPEQAEGFGTQLALWPESEVSESFHRSGNVGSG